MRCFVVLAALLATAVVPTAAQQAVDPYHDQADVMVENWYYRFVNRPPDSGAPRWAAGVRSVMAQGQGPESVLSQILGSAEFYTLSGSTPAGFVRRLYETVLGRPPGPQEMQAWLGQLYTRERSDVAYDFLIRHPQDWRTGQPVGVQQYEYRRPTRYWQRPVHHDWPR